MSGQGKTEMDMSLVKTGSPAGAYGPAHDGDKARKGPSPKQYKALNVGSVYLLFFILILLRGVPSWKGQEASQE